MNFMNIIPKPQKITFSGKYVPKGSVNRSFDADMGKEEYSLNINRDGVFLKGGSERALHYADITYKQILREDGNMLPECEIRDKPVFSYRGFMVDVCRHFFTVEEIKKIIDAAAMLKFNYFHFHLSDDQGFRAEIKKHPELSLVGGSREGSHFGKKENDDSVYSHFYTRAQLKEIAEYCKERYIEVIPEIDIPGHASAILQAYPELSCNKEQVKAKTSQGVFKDLLCAGNPATLKLIYDILDELCDIFPGKYFHLGGDEAPKDKWKKCPKCQSKIRELGHKNEEELHCSLVNRAAEYLEKKGRRVICWNEAANGGILDKNITLAYWLDKAGISVKRANEGCPVIIEKFKPYYADYPYGMYPLKDVYMFDPKSIKGLTETGKKSIVGVETPVWTEYITDFERLCYMCFPRWFAVADTAWNGRDEKNYREFRLAAKSYCDALRKMGVSSAPECDWDESPQRRLRETLAFADNLMTKNMLRQLLNVEE